MSFDPSKPVTTRDGRKARIICTDSKHSQPIIALIYASNQESVERFHTDGSFNFDKEPCCHDLVNIPEEKWRPWTADEVPVGARLRGPCVNAVIAFCEPREGGVFFIGCYDGTDKGRRWRLDFFPHPDFEHSTDLGETWHKCGVKIQ